MINASAIPSISARMYQATVEAARALAETQAPASGPAAATAPLPGHPVYTITWKADVVYEMVIEPKAA